ncbi:MAG: TolC family protein, partial [Planctomycetota bacterium]
MPIPQSVTTPPGPERLRDDKNGGEYVITPRNLIGLAFNFQPDVRSSFQRYKSEEASYDFFYSSNDAVTPRMRLDNVFGEDRANEMVDRTRDHTVAFSVEKQFFDTTRMDVSAGYRNESLNDDFGNQPFVATSVRYPLAASRERLIRTSEDIFRQNELSDAQLLYIQTVRQRLQSAMFSFYNVRNLFRQVNHLGEWLADLKSLRERFGPPNGNMPAEDLRRLVAEIEKVDSNYRIQEGRYQIDVARFKDALGLPFNVVLDFRDEPFNPFVGADHGELMQLSIETDPEIATLRNSMQNAQVQLDLARRGTWDIALLLNAESNIEGRGRYQGESDWIASLGLDVSHVDPRVTQSLSRQAQANIWRFEQAIAARENTIYVDTLEPLVRIETVGTSRDQLQASLPDYVRDYDAGVTAYEGRNLNIDDLLRRRENVYDQQIEISRLEFLVGANVAELCAATGKFFELLAE